MQDGVERLETVPDDARVVHGHVAGLPDSVSAICGLIFFRRIPGPGEVNNVVGCLNVHPEANGQRRKNDDAESRRPLESVDQFLSTVLDLSRRRRIAVHNKRIDTEVLPDYPLQQRLQISKLTENDLLGGAVLGGFCCLASVDRMNFLIADTFTDSMARLTAEEQKAVKTTAFDLQVNPAHPGLSFHKLDKARDKHFWSVRVSRDVRMIVHRTESSFLLCYADHHDKAYHWAERRRLETHPTTGAAQLVEIRERIQEVIVPKVVEQVQTILPLKPKLFLGIAESALLAYGVPQEWIADVQAADEDSLLTLADHLPSEAAEALLELATGGKPKTAPVAVAGKDPFEHPDAQRRFRVMGNAEELERALAAPWDKWIVFLHPEQRELVQRDYSGPARVSGSAGTGKTIVALHRAVHLARSHSEARVLLTTFSDPLAQSLRNKLRKLIGAEPRLAERIEVQSLNALGARLYERHVARPTIADRDRLRALLIVAAQAEGGLKFSERFLLGEWEDVVDAWQLESWESYRDVRRLGRKTRLPESQRKSLWSVFERVRASLATEGLTTTSQMFHRLAAELGRGKSSPFDFAVVDESQDIDIAQLRFLAALGAQRPNALFFAGDLGQRIFQQPFSWKSVGVDIRGRSRTLHINYRTSHQIRAHADRLLGPEVSDIDGNVEERDLRALLTWCDSQGIKVDDHRPNGGNLWIRAYTEAAGGFLSRLTTLGFKFKSGSGYWLSSKD